MADKIPVVICLDVEPDERVFDPLSRPDWQGFERTWEYFSNFRPHLEHATGSPAHFSWFFRMDPQVEYVYGSAEAHARPKDRYSGHGPWPARGEPSERLAPFLSG